VVQATAAERWEPLTQQYVRTLSFIGVVEGSKGGIKRRKESPGTCRVKEELLAPPSKLQLNLDNRIVGLHILRSAKSPLI